MTQCPKNPGFSSNELDSLPAFIRRLFRLHHLFQSQIVTGS